MHETQTSVRKHILALHKKFVKYEAQRSESVNTMHHYLLAVTQDLK